MKDWHAYSSFFLYPARTPIWVYISIAKARTFIFCIQGSLPPKPQNNCQDISKNKNIKKNMISTLLLYRVSQNNVEFANFRALKNGRSF